MSVRLTVSDLQVSRIPTALNICPEDERLYMWLNEAESLMLAQGRWWGSVTEAQFCVRDFCLTYPREVAMVEQIQVCGRNVDTEGGWYKFTRLLDPRQMRQGTSHFGTTGRRVDHGGCAFPRQTMSASTVASFATTRGANKVIRTYPTNASDVGKRLVYQGRDKNGIWVRTIQDGVMADGEMVTLALPFVDTATVWGTGAPVAVQKDVTVQRVLVYEYDTVLTTERALAEYEAGETRPTYRQSRIEGLGGTGNGCCGRSSSTSGTANTTITALVSLQHVELRAPGDWLVLQNLSAYKAAMMAVKLREERDYAGFNFEFYGTQAAGRNARGVERVVNRSGAIPLLVAEARKMSGDRTAVWVYSDETEKLASTMLGFR